MPSARRRLLTDPPPRRIALLLGLLSAIGPIGIDIYLPAFATIARDLGCGIGAVQASMAGYFLALGLGQIFYGALSDRIGRKPPILLGLALFVAGSIGCALAGGVATLIAGRFVQGCGICAIVALMRAIVRDLHAGPDAVRLMARTLLIVSVSPLLAPLAGSAIIAFASWRMIFWLLAALATSLLVATWRLLPETHVARSSETQPLQRTFGRIFADPGFRRALAMLAAAQAGASIYLAGSSAAYIGAYGLPPWTYSIAFAANAVGMIAAAQTNRALILRHGTPRVLLMAATLTLAGIAPMALASLAGPPPIALMLAGFFLVFTSFGFVMGPASVLALERHSAVAGTAAALLGTLQFGAGAAASALLSLLGGSFAGMVALQAVAAVAAWIAAWRIARREAAP
jgi:DHA1 family bicyclomycin/chloramphenicol resistance-like MFS transporter